MVVCCCARLFQSVFWTSLMMAAVRLREMGECEAFSFRIGQVQGDVVGRGERYATVGPSWRRVTPCATVR